MSVLSSLQRTARTNKLSNELKTAQAHGQRSSEAQVSELRQMVENAAKLSDEYYLAKIIRTLPVGGG
jgi:hypothetical protein